MTDLDNGYDFVMTHVRFLKTTQSPPQIVQSGVRRDWMDDTYKKHAYQCMPMTVANVMGWELRLEDEITAIWDGGNTVPRILTGEISSSGRPQAISSIVGILSINMGWVLETEKGISTWITGSPNYFIDGAAPLTATIPSWWWPDEVQMNWKITKVGEVVTFPAGSPFCFVTVYEESTMLDAEVSCADYWDDVEKIKARAKYGDIKSRNNQENPWTWTKGIKTGVDADGKSIGPTFTGLPRIKTPGVLGNE